MSGDGGTGRTGASRPLVNDVSRNSKSPARQPSRRRELNVRANEGQLTDDEQAELEA
jgi:hypothetical protein